MAFVGYSYGAHLVTALALGQDLARALVTVGGAGLGQSARAAGRSVSPGLMVAMFHNLEDELPPPGPAAMQFLGCPEPRVMPARPGGHGFGWYAANGSVAEAFGLALALVQ
jgi:pimeloyl-ACP methyl ester carboxylesterase